MEAMLTMDPEPRRHISGATACMRRKALFTLISIILSNLASSTCNTGSCAILVAALLTRISILPNSRWVVSTRFRMSPARPTWQASGYTRAGETMHSPKNCLPGSGWEIWRQDSTTVQVQGHPTRINKYSIQHLDQRSLVFYWYQSKERIIASEALGKIMLVRDSLVGGHTGGVLARVTVSDTGPDAADGEAFAAHLIRDLQRCFGR